MDNIKQYLLSVTAAAIICSIILHILDKKSIYYTIIKMLCGLFMAITMLSPIIHIQLSDFSTFFDDLQMEANAITADGITQSRNDAADIIKQEVEAYILDKASSMGLNIKVEITLSQESVPYPIGIHIQGDISPYAKQTLKRWLTDTIGIPEENQIWT